MNKCQVAEILTSSKDMLDETILKPVKSSKTFFLISAIVFLFIATLISFFYFHSTLFPYQYNNYTTEKENLTDFQQQSFSGPEQATEMVIAPVPTAPFHCIPLVPVYKVIVTLVQVQNLSCWESAACLTPQQKIEQEQALDGLKYNFIIGAGHELYIGLGFKCQVPKEEYSPFRENILHIKFFRNDSSPYLKLEEEITIAEIIHQGILCGKFLPDYSFCTVCSEDLDLCKPDINLVRNSNLHSLAVISDGNWIPCEDTMKETKDIIKSEVIKLESINNCLPYEPVTEIAIYIANSPKISCGTTSNSSCADVAKTIEQLHDVRKYNFIIGTNTGLYIGLGFRCRAIPTSTLRIKLLRLNDVSQQPSLSEWKRLSQLIEQGRSCGKILSNYSISVNCERGEIFLGKCFPSAYYNMEKDNFFFPGSTKYYYDDQETQRKVIEPDVKWLPCHQNHSHNTLKIETDEHEVVSTEHPHVTTPLTTNTKSHQYEETTQQTTNPPTRSAEYLNMTHQHR